MANRFGDAENCGANLTPLGVGRTPKFHHVDDHGSKYARYVGRVGTLAVALGIGAATTFGSVPVARADDGASGSSSSAVGGDSTTSNDGAGNGTDQGSAAKGDDGAPDSSAKDSSGAASTGDADADADPAVAEPGSGDTQDPDADEVEQGPKGTNTPEPEPASLPDEPSAKPDHGSRPDPKPAATARAVNGRSAPKAKVSEPTVRPKSVDSVDPKGSGGGVPAASSSGRKDSVSADAVPVSLPKASSKSELAPTPIAPQGPPKPAARAAAEFLNSLISAVFAPFASSGKGGLPVESPLLLALLAFARKGLGGDDTAVAEVQTTSLSLDDSSAETAAAPAARIASFAALDAVTGNPVTAVNDSITTPEDTPATGNLLTNDIAGNPDGPGEVLTVSDAGTVTTAAGGSAVIATNGDFTYTPKPNYNGADSFNYTVTDGSSSATGTVSVAVTAVNDAPVAVNDAKSLSEDYVRTFAPAELLANDTDADKPYGDTITLDSVADAVNGTVALNADGTITFAPTANYNGAASFTYKVKDSTGTLSNSATVNLTVTPVNDAPTAVNDSASVTEDTAKTFTAIELVGNDTDPDKVYGDVLAVQSVSGATGGTVALNADGTVTFTPTANYNGAASFTYKVKDSTGTVSTNSATVSLTVTPVNDVPVAVNDTKTVQEDVTRVFITGDLLSNDTDADKVYGDTLSFNSVSGATNSTVVLNADGTITFTPAANYNGVASFVYTAKDSAGAVSNGATVSVNVTAVNDAPTAVNDTATVTEDTAKTFTAADLVGNDTDPDLVYGDVLRVHSVSGATNGTAVLNADGTVTFTPTANYNGPASFTYKVKDNAGTVSANSATVAITVVGVNDAPTAVNDAGGTTAEDTPKTFTVASLVGNDTDADLVYGDVLSVHSVSGATNGTVVLNADGTVTFTPAADYNGTASFAYKVKDAAGVASANSATVTLSVTAVNDAPKAVNDSGTVVEDTAKTFTASDLLSNDTDAEGDALSVSSVAGATNGTAILNADGSVTFTPFANYNGAAVFTYKVKDANGAVSTNSGTVNLTVTGVNDAPTAVNDAKSMSEDTVRTFAPIELTANDTDPDKTYGDVLSFNSIAGATNGTVVLNADGTVTFTPTANFNGTASFTYTVKDTAGAVGATAATVTLTIYAVNDLPTAVDDAGGTTVEDTAKTFTAASLVGNDTDPDLVYGDTLKVHSVTGASNGTAVLNADGTVTFTPTANYNGAASFTYKVKDSTGSASANSATVTLTVTAVNDAPTAVNDTSIMPEDYSRTFSSAELTNNDTDPDKVYGDKLKVQSVSGATNGTAVLNADGTVTFTPTANFNGVASFTYKVKDTAGAVSANSATMSVTVTDINDAPTAVNDTGTVTEDTAKTFTAANLVGNDTDPDLVYGDSLSVQSVSGATHGSVVLNADGSVTFTPAADYNGAAGFTYTVQDSEGAVSANSGTVSLTVTGVNDAPTAANDTGTVTEDTPKIFTAANLVGNDTDADLAYGDVLSVQSVSGATNGTVVLNGDGTVTFTPTANFNGAASFTYLVKDSAGAVGASPATVTLTVAAVNDVPTAVNDAGGAVVEDTAKTFTAADLVGNDTDPDLVYGDSLSVQSVSGAANGTVVLNADGTVTFTPTANYNGAAGFTYQVKDSTGAVSANSGTVSLTVTGVNDVPTAVNDSSTTAEDTAKTFTAANLVGNDVDPDKVYGDVLSVASVSGATNGTAVLNADGTVTFTPTANFNGTGTFTYKVKDVAGAVSANSATVSITVTGVNDAPTAVNDSKTVLEDNTRVFTAGDLLSNDTDPDKVYGDVLSFHSVTGATNGTAVLNADNTITFVPNANFNGTASFTYKVKDAAGVASANSATVTVTITPINDAPVAVNDTVTIPGGTAHTFTAADLVGNDTDVDGDALVVHTVSAPTHGTVVLNADGTVTFTPTASYTGPASFNYKVKDPAGAVSLNTATVSITVTGVNTPPTAVNDTASTAEDTAKVFAAGSLTANDTDPESGSAGLSVAAVSGATHGAVVLNADGSVTFTPEADYNGAASFTYTAKDPAGAVSANSATVSIAVTAVNDAPTAVNDTGTVTEDTAKVFTAANLVGNDTDADLVYGDVLSVNSVSGASNGSVVLNADGTVTFTPAADYNGAASFTYTVKDSAGAVSANTGTVTLTVAGVNDAPTAVNDTAAATEDTAKIFTAANLVGNDTDADLAYGDSLSVQSVSGATNGTVVLNADGTVTFTPAADYNGVASFTYKVKDAAGVASANSATVTITVAGVNDAPSAVGDTGTVTEDTAKVFTAANLVGNDTDADLPYGDVLSVQSVSGAANGTVVLNADGTVTFTPAANYNGAASFTYKVKDAAGVTSANSATVTLTVTGVNDAPTAVNDTGTVTEDVAKVFTAANLVGNDTDPDLAYGDTLSVQSVAGATNGSVVLNGDGTVTFTPTANYNGAASFTYKVKDAAGVASANSGTVSLTVIGVNDAPTAVNDTGTVTEDTAKVFTAANLVGNDTDPDLVYGDSLSVQSVSGATNGSVVLNADGTVTFTPTANYNGAASFTYKVKDAAGAVSLNSGTVSLTVIGVNDAPTAVNDTGTVTEDTAKVFTAANLVGNDTDPDLVYGDSLSVQSVSGATNGSVVLNADGSVTFTPAADYNGTASFTYKVKDTAGAVSANSGTVSLTVTGVNDAPTAVNDTATTAEGTAKVFAASDLVANDTDPDLAYGDVLAVQSVSGAINGTVVLNPGGSVTFTPYADFNGVASFTYKVADGAGAVSANSATVTITVIGVNGPPTAVNDTGIVTEDTAKVFTAASLVGNDTDPDLVYGDTLSVHSVAGATNGTVVLNADGTVTFTPTANYNGAASFTYKVKDSTGAVSSNSATVTLTVTAVNDTPTAVNDTGTVTEDTAKVFTAANLVGNDTDPDLVYGDSLSVQSVSGATNGSVVLNADGSVTFTPAADYNGTASFTYKVKDAAGAVSANSGTVSLTVTGVNDAPTAVNDTGTVTEDVAKVFTAANLVGNDTDPDLAYGDVLSVQSVAGATNGSVVLNADGTVTFTPTANYNGAASFTYKVKDAAGVASANSATVTLTVTAVNDAPTAVNDTGTVTEDTAKVFTAANLVGNDTDPDIVYGDVLSVQSVAGATNGTVVLNGDGTVTFTPTANYNGAASFTYKVKDAAGVASANSATVTMTVTAVNDAPTAVNDAATTTEDTAKVFTAADLVGNDTDPDLGYGDALSVQSVSGATNGTAVLNGDGTVTFTPTANYNGAASFTYKVKDTAGVASANSATVTVTVVGVNDVPVAVNDTGTVTEDTAKVFTAANLVGNDTDADVPYGDVLSVQSVAGATNGSVVLNADGSVTFTPAADYNGAASFTYKVKDASGAVSANSGTVSLTVIGVNDAPTAVNDTGTVTEDTPKIFTAANLVGNDTDADLAYGDVLSVQSVSGAANGTVVLNADGTVTFTPAADFNGAASFTYKVKDAAGAVSANTGTVSLTVTGVNDAPTAVGDSGATAEDTAKTFTAADLTGNDIDPDRAYGDVLSVQSVAGATNGTVVLNGDGTVTFTPTANFNGAASFTYKVKDTAGVVSTNSATVNVTVTAVNDAPVAVNDTFTIPGNAPRNFTATELVGNDTDVDGDTPLSVQSVSGATNGAVVLNGDGTVTFTPTTGYSGAASFTYKVKDPAGAVSANSATVNITVSPVVNHQPTAVNDTATTVEDTQKVFAVGSLTGNDTDPDAGQTLSVNSVAGATNGNVVLNADGTVTFTPTTDFNGTATFTYNVKDNLGAVSANSATVSITVTGVPDAPTAVNDSASTAEDTAKVFTAADLTGNDIDPDKVYGDVLSVNSVFGATNGTAVLNANGTVTFTPTADFNGTGSFTYTVKDAAGNVSANNAVVSINVTAVNDAPTAVNDTANVTSGVARTFTAAELVGNDTDPDILYGDTLSVQSITGATNGTAVLNANGTVTFTSTANYSGPASFTYKVKDAAGAVSAASATVNITVTLPDPILARDDTLSTNEDAAAAGNVLTNDIAQNPDGPSEPLTVTTTGTINTTAGGTVTMAANGDYTYYPATDFNGTDTFTYTVTDGTLPDVGTVTITVAADDDVNETAVNAVADTNNTNINTPVSGNVLSNDIANNPDGAGEPLWVITTGTSVNSYGSLVLNKNGAYVYTPVAGFTGENQFSYVVTDGNSWSTGYLTITVVNTNPIVARDDSFTVNQAANYALIGNVLTNDRAQNPDGTAEPITVDPNYAYTTAQGGIVYVDGNGDVRYTPPSADFSGTDTFDYSVSDHSYLNGNYWYNTSTTDIGTVTITVTVNHPTVAVDDTVTTAKNAPVSGNVLTNDNAQNPDASIPVNYYNGAGETLTLTTMDSYTAQGGYVNWNWNGDYTYTPPNSDFTGADSFTYTVTDGTTTDVGTVNITVVDVNTHAVVAVNDVNTDLQSGSFHAVTGNVLTNDKAQNPDGPLERLTVVDNSQSVAGNTVYVDGNGYYTYYVPADFTGTDTFTYTVSDGTSTAVGTVTITVDANDPVVARPDSVTLAEDTSPSGYTGNVLTNDIAQNPDGPNEYLYVSAYDQTSAAGASVGVYGDGSYYYYPAANFHGTDTFTYTVTDGTTSSVGTVTVTVTPVPDPVAAVNDSYDANKTTPITGNVLTNDIAQNPDGPAEPLSVIGTGHITSAYGGSVVINSDGVFTYTAQAGFVGNDWFYYSVTDGTSAAQTYVNVVVRDVVARADNYTTAEDTPLTGNVLTNDIAQNPDGPGETLTVYAPGNVNTYHGGTAVIAADGSFTYTPPADYNGTDTFNYTVTDNVSYDSTTVTVNVTPVPDALQLALTPMTAAGSGAQVIYTVSVVHPDPNETVTFSVTTQPTKGTVSQGGNAFYYTPDPAAFNYTPGATDSFVVTADDGNGDVKTQLVTYTYAPVTSLTLADYSYDISASDDGTRTYVLLQGSNQVQIVNTGGSTPTNIGVVNVEAGSTAIAASANGTRAFVANYNANTVSMIDTSGAIPTVTSIAIGATPVSVAVSANGTRAFTVNTDSTVSIINASGGIPTATSVNVGSNPTDVAVSADGTRAFVTNLYSGTVSIINTSGASPTVIDVTLDYSPNAVKVSDNGAVAIVNSYYGNRVTIVKYNGTTATTTTLALPVSSYLSNCIAISDDGTRAFITSQSNAKYALGVIDTTVASPTVTWFGADAPMYHVVSSSDGSHAYAMGNGAGVYLFDTVTGEYTLLKGTAWGYYYEQVAVSDNGLRVVSTDGSNLTLAVLPASLL